MSRISTDLLLYNKAEKTFTAEISDLNNVRFEQVYSDSCDEGLTIVSARTGKEIACVVTVEKRDSDGDLQYWQLEPTAQALRSCPEARGLKVILFND